MLILLLAVFPYQQFLSIFAAVFRAPAFAKASAGKAGLRDS